MKSRYEAAKYVFVDSIDIEDYIDLDTSVSAYTQLSQSIQKPLKMILLFGKPGTGKSILLNRLHTKLKHQRDIYYFETPTTDEKEFFAKLYEIVANQKLPADKEVNFGALVRFCQELRNKRDIVILLDEAQMYSPQIMEKIRLLSDTRSIKFIVSLHKTEDEDLIAKAHFQSRIWEIIELKNATIRDLQTYVHKKLLKKNLFDIANSIHPKAIRLIYRFTQGNFRECNKLMFSLFELCQYYDLHEPSKIRYDKIPLKLIEMAAIKLGYIDV